MRLFGYKTQIGDVGDTMPFYYNGEWHIFYLDDSQRPASEKTFL